MNSHHSPDPGVEAAMSERSVVYYSKYIIYIMCFTSTSSNQPTANLLLFSYISYSTHIGLSWWQMI